jgi:hypothetical protein
MVLFVLVGAAAFAGERAYAHHKKSKAKKLARSQPQQSHTAMETVLTTPRSTEVEDEDSYEDLPAYQKDQGQVQPPMYSPTASQETIPVPERSPLREKAAM